MLKIIILSFLFADVSMAAVVAPAPCINTIAQSEVQNAINQVPGTGQKVCGAAVKDPCVCYDGITWDVAMLNADGTLGIDPGKMKVRQANIAAAQKAVADAAAIVKTQQATINALAAKAAAGTMTTQDQADALKVLLTKGSVGP